MYDTPNVITSSCIFKRADCITAEIEKAKVEKQLLVVFPWCSPGASDIYTGLYAGWVRHIFTSPNSKYVLKFLMIQTSVEEYWMLMSHALKLLPAEAFWATFGLRDGECYNFYALMCCLFIRLTVFIYSMDLLYMYVRCMCADPFSIAGLGLAKANGSLAEFSVIHLNPMFQSRAEQDLAYRHHRLVVRNSFNSVRGTDSEICLDESSSRMAISDLYERSIVTVPMGASYYGNSFGQTVTPLGKLATAYALTPSYERTYGCVFVGRRQYPGKNAFTEVREELFRLLETHSQFPCAAANYDLEMEFDERYRQNVERLVNTVFVPCPPGIEAETFRHYEALEAGAIPLIVTSKGAEYLLSEWWRDYPGPVFTNWMAVSHFLRLMTKE